MNAVPVTRHQPTRVRRVLQRAEVFRYRLEYRRRLASLWRSKGPGKRESLTRKEKNDILEYWSRFHVAVNLEWFRLFKALHGSVDPRYVPEETFRTVIEPMLCRRDVSAAYHDKNQLDRQFADMCRPVTVLRNIYGRYFDAEYNCIARSDVARLLLRHQAPLFIKPAISGTGSGANVAVLQSHADGLLLAGRRVEFSEIESVYLQDFVLQRAVEQHDELSRFHAGSLNTLRLITLRIGNDIAPLAATFRMGNGSHIDNGHAGGLLCGVSLESGSLTSFACDVMFRRHQFHPLSKQLFQDSQVPSFGQVVRMAMDVHRRLFHFDQISCDIAVLPDGRPCLIEVNTFGQGVEPHQFLKGAPLFGEHTDRILRVVSDRSQIGWNY